MKLYGMRLMYASCVRWIALFVLLVAQSVLAETLEGRVVRIVDGDTLLF